jgi:hypothetical protein
MDSDKIDQLRTVATEMLLISLYDNLEVFEGTKMYLKVANIREQCRRLKNSIDIHHKQFYPKDGYDISDQAIEGSKVFDGLMIACLESVNLPDSEQEEFSIGLTRLFGRFGLYMGIEEGIGLSWMEIDKLLDRVFISDPMFSIATFENFFIGCTLSEINGEIVYHWADIKNAIRAGYGVKKTNFD